MVTQVKLRLARRRESAQLLSSLKNAQLKAAGQIRGQKAGLQQQIAGAQHQVLGVERHIVAERPVNLEAHLLGRRDADVVADVGEHHPAGDRVIAVRARGPHMQEEVDLGRGQALAPHDL